MKANKTDCALKIFNTERTDKIPAVHIKSDRNQVMKNNRLIVAAAGSGKTTFLVEEALKIKDKNVLMTTFTEANEAEIRKKIIQKNKFIPSNIIVQTWFSMLLQHGKTLSRLFV